MTLGQIITLYEHYQKEELDKFKLRASLFGVSFDDKKKKETDQSDFMFKDPEEYKNLPIEERKKLTEKMMRNHKKWAGKALNEKSA